MDSCKRTFLTGNLLSFSSPSVGPLLKPAPGCCELREAGSQQPILATPPHPERPQIQDPWLPSCLPSEHTEEPAPGGRPLGSPLSKVIYV